jgi:glycerol kinase
MERRASLSGISFGTTKNHIVRAALESIAYQIKDVISAMEKDAQLLLKELNTDGGITSNKFIMQFIADLLNKQVINLGMPDVSALGAAYLSGLKAGVYKDINFLKQLNSNKIIFQPATDNKIDDYYNGWINTIKSK